MILGFMIAELFFGGIGVWALSVGEIALGSTLCAFAGVLLLVGVAGSISLRRRPMPAHDDNIRKTKYDGLAVLMVVIMIAIYLSTR